MSEQKALFTVTKVTKDKEGNISFEFDLSDEFVETFKKEQGLKKWSQKKFDSWAAENIEAIIVASGIGPQITELYNDDSLQPEDE
jgi:hypothetical protein